MRPRSFEVYQGEFYNETSKIIADLVVSEELQNVASNLRRCLRLKIRYNTAYECACVSDSEKNSQELQTYCQQYKASIVKMYRAARVLRDTAETENTQTVELVAL